MRRLALFLLTSLLLAFPAGADETEPPASFEVKTEVVAFDARSERRATQTPTAFVLSREGWKGPAVDAGPDETHYYGTLGAAPEPNLVVAIGRDDRLHVVAHVENGIVTSPPAVSKPSTQPGRVPVVVWKVTGVRAGGSEVALTVQRRSGATAGRLTLDPAAAGERPTVIPLDFHDEVPSSVVKPADLGSGAVHGVGVLRTRVIAVSMGAPKDGSLRVAIDRDTDNDLSDADEAHTATGEPAMQALGGSARRVGTRWSLDGLEVAGRRGSLRIERLDETVTGTVAPAGGRRGRVDVGGVPHLLLLLDGDLDGSFTGASDLWWFGPADRVDAAHPHDSRNMFEGNEHAYRPDGGAWRLASVAADGTARVERAPKPPAVEAYLARRGERVNRARWFPMFDAEAPTFRKDRGIDLARPKADAPATWHHVLTPAEARAIAQEEGKPLLVDFEADWCVWCKRFDYYTYPDREVAERLSRFALVKMNVELASVDEWKDLSSRGLPSIVAFGADGKPVRFVSPAAEKPEETDRVAGWFAPGDFVKILDALHAAATRKP